MFAKLAALFRRKTRMEYEVIHMKEYKAKRKRLYYYVVVPEDTVDDTLLQIFNELDIGSQDEVTIWFYKSDDEVRHCLPYSVAMLARKGKGEPVTVTR
ncbi:MULTISPECIES: hypothetical protein [unclassified Dehalobacter]|uniref:hypothetical protein n=1 Tax=unclassified Dehalobacter TaxID=2635733 RepID=UPI0010492250|nr:MULTISPECIES: hypothetical protein [unclassified Dehalobacter]TCX51937.1 hypothetical protein C1I36_06365 [Dehalobacter sp. 14DCB1]TCX52997.1 hypothetical protein C1I38_08045 [Dehalobacter sp. 12DCB1]